MSNFQQNDDLQGLTDPAVSPREKTNLLRSSLDKFRVTWRLMWDKRTGFFPRLILLAALAYLLLPFDLLPAMVVGIFGGLDDLGVITTALAMFYQAVPDDLVTQVHRELTGKRTADKGDVIDGSAH